MEKKIDAKKRIIFYDIPGEQKCIMSNGHIFSSHRYSQDSSQGTSNSTNGASSDQSSSRSSSFNSGWKRQSSNYHSQASSGSGWGRTQHASETSSGGWGRPSFERPAAAVGGGWGKQSFERPAAAVGGGWGKQSSERSAAAVGGGWGKQSSERPAAAGGGAARPSPTPNFACVLIAALLLLPGVTQPIADEFTQNYIQRNHIVDPHTQDDIERAISEFNQQQQLQQKPPAPPEGYTIEYVSYCFHQKYVLPASLQEIFDSVVQTIINHNPQRYGQKLDATIERALLKIHEELQTKSKEPIVENHSYLGPRTMNEEFVSDLTQNLSSYRFTSPEGVDQFVAEYMRKPCKELSFTMIPDPQNGNLPICINSAELYTKRHKSHAIHSYFLSLDLDSILRDRFDFLDGIMPFKLFSQLSLSQDVRKLIRFAMVDRRVVNGFLIIYPPDDLARTLRKTLEDLLVTPHFQSYDVNIIPLTSKGPPKTGDICIVIPAKINVRTKDDEKNGPSIFSKKPVTSQYQTDRPKGIYVGIDETLNWNLRRMPYTFLSKNMTNTMQDFCSNLRIHWGAIPLFIQEDPRFSSSKQLDEDPEDSFPIHQEHSFSQGGGWGAAAPK